MFSNLKKVHPRQAICNKNLVKPEFIKYTLVLQVLAQVAQVKWTLSLQNPLIFFLWKCAKLTYINVEAKQIFSPAADFRPTLTPQE